jgi:hypothetical protein
MRKSFVGINGIDHLLKIAEEQPSIKPEKVQELKTRIDELHDSGQSTKDGTKIDDSTYQKLNSAMQELENAPKEGEEGTFEKIFGIVGSIIGWGIRGGTILEDFLTLGAGIADDVISFLAASAVESGAKALGRKVDQWTA